MTRDPDGRGRADGQAGAVQESPLLAVTSLVTGLALLALFGHGLVEDPAKKRLLRLTALGLGALALVAGLVLGLLLLTGVVDGDALTGRAVVPLR